MQRKDEWIQDIDLEYHIKQYRNIYRMTDMFFNWLDRNIDIGKGNLKVLDMCCGAGANIFHFKNRFPKNECFGIEFNQMLVETGNKLLQTNNICDSKIEQGDLYNLDSKYVNMFNGIIMHQTLSWLPEYKDALLSLFKLNPDWVALSSLFYEGSVDCIIDVIDYKHRENPKKCFYNIYSLPILEEFCNENGYSILKYEPFEIDIDIPQKESFEMGTYTQMLNDGKRIQLSGPVLMSWYFVIIQKNER